MTYLTRTLSGIEVRVDHDGYYSLNDIHKVAGSFLLSVKSKNPYSWLRSNAAQEYVGALEMKNLKAHICVIKTIKSRGQVGTWAHELVALEYARWLCPELAAQVNSVFIKVCRGDLDGACRISRDLMASNFLDMNEALLKHRDRSCKKTTELHYGNEARLICLLLTGNTPLKISTIFGWKDWRSQLDEFEMTGVSKAEVFNAQLLDADKPYEDRKNELWPQFSQYRKHFEERLGLAPPVSAYIDKGTLSDGCIELGMTATFGGVSINDR
tara:strand:- start:5080 stop:5886 length:807 start_codon:yes stop_codon:yes gene_type:complete